MREIAAGSRVHGRFFVLLITASMIASFGLIADSTAVIIGAMLVSPLMTPIFGVALGMLRGNPRLLARALTSELVGVVLAIGSAYLVGLPQLTFGAVTAEMLARTQPNLMDLLVAVFAGFAGAYALVDARVSPALPGVAIATAIVPPLATCGLCLALGAWSGAGGALLLFLANFVSILVVALITFWLGGLGRTRRRSARRAFTQLGPTAVAFAVVAVILTNSLMRIVRDRRLETGVRKVLQTELSAKHGADLMSIVHTSTRTGIQVLATVRAQRTISPAWVSATQSALAESLGIPAELVVRTIRSRDVSPLGSSLQVVRPYRDGDLLMKASVDDTAREALSAQVLREVFENEPGFELTRIEYGVSAEDVGVVVAYVNAIRRLEAQEIGFVEELLRQRLDDPSLRFLIRVNASNLRERSGPIRLEWTNVAAAGAREIARLPAIETALNQMIEEDLGMIPLYMHFNWMDERWRVLVEVAGPHLVTTDDVAKVQSELATSHAEAVEVLIWQRNEYVAMTEGYTTYASLTEPLIGQRRNRLYELFRTTSNDVQSRGAEAPSDGASDR
ncbi:MAG: DUF389 domain-containing protein [Planctomycetota bacterium]